MSPGCRQESLAPAFAAMGDGTRWTILTRLGRRPASASALARELPISRQAIVRHLTILRRLGLVEAEQVGRELVHRAVAGRVDAIAHQLAHLAHEWNKQLT